MEVKKYREIHFDIQRNKLNHFYLELHDAVFVVGALEETVVLRGMRYHPIDIENTVMRCHQKIAEWSVLHKHKIFGKIRF